MRALYVALDGNVNVYTMDHRGTGRSNPLDCVASQATTSGSPLGGDIDVSEFAKCAQELQTKYGDMAAFSITSAATDISTFISKYQSDSKTFVYGVSYGSALVERLMHLDTKEIVGYILDGVSTTSGADVKDGMYMSNWDVNFDEVATRFFGLLSTNSKKAADKFGSKSISNVLENVLKEMDKKPSSKCAKLVTDYVATTQPSISSNEAAPASYYVRQILGKLLTNSITRAYIPVIIYRLERCSKKDRAVLNYFLKAIDANFFSSTSEEATLVSLLEYYLIVFSEMWESPTPDLSTLMTRFTDAKVSTGPIAPMLSLYCAFTKDTSTACTSLVNASALGSGPALAYKKDKYWNIAAKIPSQASVMIMSGKLDPQTPHKYAERLYEVLDGTEKELIAFEYTPHGALLNAQYAGSLNPWGYTYFQPQYCGVQLLALYVKNGGDLSKVDKTCVSYTNTYMSNVDATANEKLFFGTDYDIYDGALYEYYSTELKTPLIIVSIVGGLLATGLASHLHSKRRARARAAAAARQQEQAGGVQGSPTNATTFVLSDGARTVEARV